MSVVERVVFGDDTDCFHGKTTFLKNILSWRVPFAYAFRQSPANDRGNSALLLAVGHFKKGEVLLHRRLYYERSYFVL